MSKRKALSSNNRTYLAMTIPIVILFFLFNTLPLITGAIYSFTNYRGYGTFDFVGLRNYIDLFSDERVLHSYLFTFKYAIVGTILINCLSLLLAMGLNSRIRCKSLLRGVYFVPNILGGLIVGIFSALSLPTSFRLWARQCISAFWKTVFLPVRDTRGSACWLSAYGRQLQ